MENKQSLKPPTSIDKPSTNIVSRLKGHAGLKPVAGVS
jgi:hypothetical protein